MAHRSLLTLALIPLLINTVIYVVLFYVGLTYFNSWLDRLLPHSDQWYWIALGWLLTILILVFLLAVMVFHLHRPDQHRGFPISRSHVRKDRKNNDRCKRRTIFTEGHIE